MEENLKIPSEILEEMLISYSLHNASFFLRLKDYLATSSYKKKSYFNDEKNQLIFNILSRWYDKFRSYPTPKEMKLYVSKIDEDEEIKLYLNAMVDKYFAEDVSRYNEKNLVEEAQQFIIENRVIESMALSQLDMQKGTYSNIVERMRSAVNVSFDKDLGVSIKDVQGALQAFNSISKGSVIELGFPTLDRVIPFAPEEILVVAGVPGIGKTAILGNFAINAYRQGKKVLVCSMETGVARLLMRYYNNLLHRTGAELLNNMESIPSQIEQSISGEGDIIVKEFLANTTSSSDILMLINDLAMYKNWKPDLVISDYILIMSTNDKKMSSDNPFKYYKTVTEELRNIAKIHKIPVISAAQINREGMGDGGGSKAITTAKDIAESRGIYDTADYFLTVNQPSKDKEKGNVTLYLDKNRNGSSQIKVKCDVDYQHMLIKECAN